MKEYGKFNKESDGRISGHVMRVGEARRDGKFPVTHHFASSGKMIKKVYTLEKLNEEIQKINLHS
jgi:hypothetical protein